MQTFTDAAGVSYPVSDSTPITNPEGWVYAEEFIAAGKWKAGQSLTERERAWLTAQTNRNNMQRVVTFLAGRDFRDVGPTLDCVHGQRWSPDTCGCVHDEVFHHFTKGEPKEHRVNKACRHHQGLPPAAHRGVLLDETRHRGKVREEIAKHLGVDPLEVEATFDDARELRVDHPALRTTQGKAGLAAKLAAAIGQRKVHLP